MDLQRQMAQCKEKYAALEAMQVRRACIVRQGAGLGVPFCLGLPPRLSTLRRDSCGAPGCWAPRVHRITVRAAARLQVSISDDELERLQSLPRLLTGLEGALEAAEEACAH